MSIFTHKIIFCYTLHLEASLPVSDKTPKNTDVIKITNTFHTVGINSFCQKLSKAVKICHKLS